MMDILTDILSYLFIIAIFSAVPLIVVIVVVYRNWKKGKNKEAFSKIAPALDLIFEQKTIPKLKGTYNNCKVELGLDSREVGTGEDQDTATEYFTYCEAYFPHRLNLLLDISCPQGWFARKLNSHDIKIGQPDFDKKFSVKCYDENIARNLLSSDFPSNDSQNLMGDLMLVSNKIKYIDINDNKVYTEEKRHFSDFDKIKQMLDATTYSCVFLQFDKYFPINFICHFRF